MKIKLKLTRVEMECVVAIVGGCSNALRGVTFPEVQYRDALAGLTLKLAAKRLTLKKTNRLTLTDLEALALYTIVGDLVEQFPPLEMGVGYILLEEIERQRSAYVGLMRSNLRRMAEEQQLLMNR